MVNPGFCCKMNRHSEEQKGRFIGILFAGLGGSLLPSLFGGKVLSHVGDSITSGKGFSRADVKKFD